MMDSTSDRPWAVVLAAGEGTRMASLTRVLYGWDLPKQFATLVGDRTMLQLTMERIAPVAPPERTVVVVDDSHESLAREQLCDYQDVQIVLQPGNRGTGPGVLLPLAHVRARAPEARVVIFPADHHVRRPEAFVDAVVRAVTLTAEQPSRLALVGATAESPATDLGWIVPTSGSRATPMGGVAVERFVEKPPEAEASRLMEQGGLWNTMVLAAQVSTLWRVLASCLPEQTRALEEYAGRIGQPDARRLLADAYSGMPAADLSKAVLENTAGLSMVPMVNAGWSDCGTPKRLLECIEGPEALRSFGARLRQAPRAIENSRHLPGALIVEPGELARGTGTRAN
jgi:mannose-1-phosphate guanylyltransferase